MELSFLKLLNTSISASWLILVVIGLRLVLKKAPKSIHCLLWALVAVRLLMPFSIESDLSLVPSAQTVPEMYLTLEGETRQYGTVLEAVGNSLYSPNAAPQPTGASVDRVQVQDLLLTLGWAVGVGILALYALVSYLRLRHKVAPAVKLRGNIWVCDYIDTPFILGLFRPRIYIPSNLAGEELVHVLNHERAHLKRRDHWWKPLGFLLLTVYWFNPLIWVAYILLCRDIEMACDEKVIRDLGVEEKKAYSAALLNCSVKRHMIAACPLAFGEVGVKTRVKSVLNYKKPAFWVIVIALVLSAVVAVCFLTDPVPKPTPAEVFAQVDTGDIQWAQATFWEEDGTEHLELTEEQANELLGLLKNIDSGAYVEKNVDHHVSLMLNCGEKEILLQWDGSFVTFTWDSATADLVADIVWGVQDSELNEFFRGLEEKHNRKMTLVDVIDLARKGETLTWEDLEPFYGMDIGSGLFVMKYPINEEFELVATSGSMEGKPMRVMLVSGEDEIDIRTGDLMGFLESHQADRVTQSSFGIGDLAVTIPEGWEYEGIPYTEDSGSFGVAFWPQGVSEGRVELRCYDQLLGVCGTGLETVPGKTAEGVDVCFGYYDGSDIWSYMTYEGFPGNYVATTVQVDSWWAEFGGEAEQILGSVRLTNGLADKSYILSAAKEAMRETEQSVVASLDPKLAGISTTPMYMVTFDSTNNLWRVGMYMVWDSSPRAEVYLDVYGNLVDWQDWGIMLYGEEITADGMILVCQQSGSVPGDRMTTTGAYQAQLMTGAPYWLERYVDGVWEEVPTLQEEVVWTMEGWLVNRYDTTSWKVNWKNLYGTLESGTYRLGKSFSMSNYLAESEDQNYYAAFVIPGETLENTTEAVNIEELIDTICSSPLESSAPGAYIYEHQPEYDQLLEYPEQTLRYCFEKFLSGGQTDLKGHIMAAACKEIVLEWENVELKGIYMTGQEWFYAYYEYMLHGCFFLSDEELQVQYPAAAILREMAIRVDPVYAGEAIEANARLYGGSLNQPLELSETEGGYVHFCVYNISIGDVYARICDEGKVIPKGESGVVTVKVEDWLGFPREYEFSVVSYSYAGDVFIHYAIVQNDSEISPFA